MKTPIHLRLYLPLLFFYVFQLLISAHIPDGLVKTGKVKELQKSIVAKIKELVNPNIDKLNKSAFDGRQKAFLGIIQSNLNDIISPFIGSLSSKYLKFTPMKVQVANFIKHGKTTKNIAGRLNLSIETIKPHRKKHQRQDRH